MIKTAKISNCGQYRYELRRTWDRSKGKVLFIGLNPSTADEASEDNTSRVCINYARKWGFGGLIIANLYAFRATLPKDLWNAENPIGPKNDAHLKKLIAEADMCLCAWSQLNKNPQRTQIVLEMIANPMCLCILKDGSPGHPLYKSKNLTPIKYDFRFTS